MSEFIFDPSSSANDFNIGMCWPVNDTTSLVQEVKNYLKQNNIRGYVFAKKVLNVPNCYFSSLLNSKNSDRKWENMTIKQQICFARMSYWMSNKATFGNNPHLQKNVSSKRSTSLKVKKPLPVKKPRTLFQSLKNGGGGDIFGPGTSSSSNSSQPNDYEVRPTPNNHDNHIIDFDDSLGLEVDPFVDQIVDVETLTLEVLQDGYMDI